MHVVDKKNKIYNLYFKHWAAYTTMKLTLIVAHIFHHKHNTHNKWLLLEYALYKHISKLVYIYIKSIKKETLIKTNGMWRIKNQKAHIRKKNRSTKPENARKTKKWYNVH